MLNKNFLPFGIKEDGSAALLFLKDRAYLTHKATKEFMALDLLIQGVFRHSIDIKLAASIHSLLILLMSIKTDVCGEIADLFILKILALVLIPAERIRISVMQNIPEVGLCVAPKNIIHLIAAARGKIEVGFG